MTLNGSLAGLVAATTKSLAKTSAALMVDYSCALRLTSSISVVWELDKFSGTPWVVQNAKRAV